MPTNRKQTPAEIARHWGCDARTVSRWKREGAPLGDDARMRTWLAGRKNLPPSTKRKLADLNRARRSRVVAPRGDRDEVGNIGAPAALRRLEQAEIDAFRLLESALASGDPVETKVAREGWLKVGDSLRRYDLMVARERRDSGEVIQRAEVEKHISGLVTWLKLAIVRTAADVANRVVGETVAEIEATLRTVLFEQVLNAVVAIKGGAPDWVIAAMLKPMDDTLENASGAVSRRAEVFETIFNAMAQQSAQQVCEVRAATGVCNRG